MKYSKQFLPVSDDKYLICFDLDGTLISHQEEFDSVWVRSLCTLMREISQEYEIYFAVITGSNYQEAINKLSKLGILLYIDYLAVGFGSYLFKILKRNKLQLDIDWHNKILEGFNVQHIYRIVEHTKKIGVTLIPENRSKSNLKLSYYFYDTSPDSAHKVKIIKKITTKYRIKSIISRCNPVNGDPADAFDVDLIPVNAGKDKIMVYLQNQHGILAHNIIAFGDSYNDISMLKLAGHGYMVANATPELISQNLNSCQYAYSRGIADILYELFKNELK